MVRVSFVQICFKSRKSTMKRTVLSVATLVAVGFVGSAQAVNLVNETNSATPTSGELQPGSSSYVNTSGGTTYVSSRGVQILRESTSAQMFQAYCIDPKTAANISSNAYATTDLDTFFTGGSGGYSTSGYHKQLTNGNYGTLVANGKDNLAGGTAVRNNLNELFSYAYADSLQSGTNATAFGLGGVGNHHAGRHFGQFGLQRDGRPIPRQGLDERQRQRRDAVSLQYLLVGFQLRQRGGRLVQHRPGFEDELLVHGVL
jgi:hypothetical protein